MAASLFLNARPASPPAASAVQRPRESRPMTKPEPEPCRHEAGPGFDEPGFGPDLDLLMEPRMNALSCRSPRPGTKNRPHKGSIGIRGAGHKPGINEKDGGEASVSRPPVATAG